MKAGKTQINQKYTKINNKKGLEKIRSKESIKIKWKKGREKRIITK